MRIVVGAEEARRTVLRRRPAAEMELGPAGRARTRAVFGADLTPAEAVQRIIADVRDQGDAAVRRYGEAFDGVPYHRLEVPRAEVEAAAGRVAPELRAAIQLAAARVRRYHEGQLRRVLSSYVEDGLGVQVRPLAAAGFYAPGSVAVSAVLHAVIPAKVAGVGAAVLVTPPAADGCPAAEVLAAAWAAGADRVLIASGAQAIAALAYGTETFPRVDKVCGPGGLFVTLAKRAVFGDVGIDAIYGPTETLIIADGDADPALCAADLIAQAEHDELAAPVLITDSRALAERVAAAVTERLASLPRGAIAAAAFANRGGAVVAASLEEAVQLANEYAPEHLCILARDARRLAGLVRNAGGVFIGDASPEALGDYVAGPSHVMPTGGSARWASPLGVQDFLKFSTVIDLAEKDLFDLGPAGAVLARAEGLVGHARAIEERLPK